MIDKIGLAAYSAVSIVKNQSVGGAINDALQAFSDLHAQDTVTLSEQAQNILTLKPIEKFQLDRGAAPNELAGVIYVRSLPVKP